MQEDWTQLTSSVRQSLEVDMNYFGPLPTSIQWHRKDAASGRWFCWASPPSRLPWPCCWPWLAARPSASAVACFHWTNLFLPCNPGRHQSTRLEPSPPAQSFSSPGHTQFSLNALFGFVFILSDRVSHWTPGNTPASTSQVMGLQARIPTLATLVLMSKKKSYTCQHSSRNGSHQLGDYKVFKALTM